MVNSTPAMVLPVRSWMIPAISWTIPPDISATAKTIGVTPSLTQPMLITLSMNVGTANAASAKWPSVPPAGQGRRCGRFGRCGGCGWRLRAGRHEFPLCLPIECGKNPILPGTN